MSALAGSAGEGPPLAWATTFWAPPPTEAGIWSPHWTERLWAVNSCRGLSAGSGGQEERDNVSYHYGSHGCARFHAARFLQAGPAWRPYL